MTTIGRTQGHAGLRIALTVGGALAVLLVTGAVLRPDMMGMAMVRSLIVGFGL